MTKMLIGLDWGTSRLRGFVLSDGRVIDRQQSVEGINNVEDGTFRLTFERFTTPWFEQYGPMPVLACGMVGSRQGWVEAPYLNCPADPADVAGSLVEVHDDVWIVPGICYRGEGPPDVMRGEETQVLGERSDGLFVMPGTHSKWVSVEDDCIQRFATFMSGELYGVLKEHSILGRMMTDDEDVDAFDSGVRFALEEDASLLNQLFSARTLGLFHELPERALADYLSGLIIGTEIKDGLRRFTDGAPVTVVGEHDLARRYRRALVLAGVAERSGIEDSVAHGLYEIAVRAVMV